MSELQGTVRQKMIELERLTSQAEALKRDALDKQALLDQLSFK
jgi:hypothetical protein